jgi:hypothetical protein
MFEVLARDRRRLRRGTRAFTRELDLGQARVFVDHGFQWDGANNVWLTRARASFVVHGGPEFDIRPRSLWTRVLGIQPGISSGDPCFDDFFVVKTPDPEETWSALTTRVRSLLAGAFEDARLVSNGRMVSLWREGDFGREVDAEGAAEVVCELVHFRAGVVDELRRLPGALYTPARGPWDDRKPPSVVLHTPTPVRIGPTGPTTVGSRSVMTASAPCGRASRIFRIEIDARGRARGGTEAFPRGAAGAIPELGACSLRGDGRRVVLTWKRLETRRSALLAGAHLIGAFAATEKNGLYR